jgi:hypothetical protein
MAQMVERRSDPGSPEDEKEDSEPLPPAGGEGATAFIVATLRMAKDLEGKEKN